MPHIVCIGDSLTEGDFNGGYPKAMEEMLRLAEPNSTWSTSNYGTRGSSAMEWLSKVTASYVAGCDVIIVMLGTNDAQTKSYRFDEGQFSANLTQLGRRLMSEAPGATLLLAVPPPAVAGGSFAQYFDTNIINTVYPRLIPQIARSLGVECVDCFAPFGGASPNSKAFSDGIHLEKDGIKILATAMCGGVRKGVSSKKRKAPNQSVQQPMPPNNSFSFQPTQNQPVQQPNNWPPQVPTQQKLELPGISAKNGYSLGSAPTAITSPGLVGIQTPSSQNLKEGSIVEVYTKTLAKWFAGKVTAIDAQMMTVEFTTHEGKVMTKSVTLPSTEIRLTNGVSNGAAQTSFPRRAPDAVSPTSISAVSPCITPGLTPPISAVPMPGVSSPVGAPYTVQVNSYTNRVTVEDVPMHR